MDRLLRWVIRALSTPDWAEAMTADAEHLPEGPDRTRWLAGAAFAALTQSVVLQRIGGLAAVCTAGSLVTYTVWRYPDVVGGEGGSGYLTLAIVVLTAFAGGFVWLTRPRRVGAGETSQRGTASGFVAGILAGMAAMPFGGPLAELGVTAIGLPLMLSSAGAVIAIAVARTRGNTRSARAALITGVWATLIMSILVFVIGLGMAVVQPLSLAVDPAVAANHSGVELVGADVGETAVGYILGLIVGPVFGLFAATLAVAAAGLRRRNGDAGEITGSD